MLNFWGNFIAGLPRSALVIAITLFMLATAGLAFLFTLVCAPPLNRLQTP